MCQSIRSPKALGAWTGYCCHGSSFRRFITTKEELERLEEYQDELKKELEAVAEHIEKLEKN